MELFSVVALDHHLSMQASPWLLLLLSGFLAASILQAAEPEAAAKDLPRVPATPPAKALGTFRIKPGFRLDLVAAEPLLVDPVAVSFDENGRLYVVEMRDYSERRDEKLGRIRLLEDTNGDGVYDRSTVFADGLGWPTAVICYDGGVFVGATPDILYLKDTNGDGVADVRRVVFTGFGQGVDRLNVQQLLNSFQWGLDNRVHGALGGTPAKVSSPEHPERPVLELRGRDFSFDPRTLEIRAESGGGQHGLSFDNTGRKFVCSNSSHLRLVMYEDRYAARNPDMNAPPASVEIPVDGGAATVYRISPDEPWRVIRTAWRVAGKVPGPIEGGGRASGYFTGATGATIYRGNALPLDFVGDAFIGDAGGNLVHRKKLRSEGVSLQAERPADEQNVEFLASTDTWFRPVQFANAPDGGLYVLDMYRETIEHPWSLPESLKKHLDLNSGNDMGRIYRIVPEGFKQPAVPHLGNATTRELVETLAHPNGWHRDAAARLLFEREDPSAVPMLTAMVRNGRASLGRMQAFCLLEGLHGLSEPLLVLAAVDTDPAVRRHAARLLETLVSPGVAARGKLEALLRDADPLVRYQAAFTAGVMPHPDKARILADFLQRESGDFWMRFAALVSVGPQAASVFELLAQDGSFVRRPGGQEARAQLAMATGARNDPGQIDSLLANLVASRTANSRFTDLNSLGDGLQRSGKSLSQIDAAHRLQPVFDLARKSAADAQLPEAVRLPAIQLLGHTTWAGAKAVLTALLKPGEPETVQRAAISAAGRFADPDVAVGLLGEWKSLSPGIRGETVSVLLRRPERIRALLMAIEAGRVSASALSAAQSATLRQHRDTTIRDAAENVLGGKMPGARSEILAKLKPALGLKGLAASGKVIYHQRCATCHRLANQGYAVGPDLETVVASGPETLLGNIIDPNREVASRYANYTIETVDGEEILGIIAAETAGSVTVRNAGGMEKILPRSRIKRMQSDGLSLMPEGLEDGLGMQGVADLLAYIQQPH